MSKTEKIESSAGASLLGKAHYEAFAQNVAAGMLLIDAWCAATGAEATPGRRVTSTRVNAREDVMDRIAYLRRNRAVTGAPERLSAHRLSDLMEEVTEALTGAAEASARAGASYAQKSAIRKAIVVHSGRSQRVESRAPPPEKVDYILPICDFYYCTCDGVS